jgi:glycosyltransferase involved in cell wall biosynthesis
MRLLFVCRMFENVAGGVERMAINIMNAMVERGHDVSLFTWDLAGARAYFPMHDSIVWHRLDMGHAGQTADGPTRARRALRFRRIVRQMEPDVATAFQHGPWLFAELGLAGLDIPVILAERNAPDRFDHTRAGRHRRWIWQSMRSAAAIAVQNNAFVDSYPSFLRSRMVVIPNPVFPAGGRARPAADKEQRTLLTVGRLSYQKNYAVLLWAFARLAGSFPEWRLRIVGEGEDRPALEALVDELELRERVTLPGAVREITAEYEAADLYCLSSRWEGFPNTLAEAMAHGLPVVAYADCAGTGQLIEAGRNGLLARGNGDPGTLAETLAALMGDDRERGRMGAVAAASVGRFDPEKTYDRWESLFRRVGTR